MKRFLRRTIFCLVPVALAVLVLGVPPAAPDLLQSVGLSCSDGTALDLAVSTTELTALSDAVAAINLYPAGDPPLACSLSADPPGSGNPHYDYAVGGGRVAVDPAMPTCQANFSLDAHVPATQNAMLGAASGHVNYTIPASPACASSGELRVDITCLDVGPSIALMRGTVKMATGFFSNPPRPVVFITARDQDTASFDAITSPSDVFLPSQMDGTCGINNFDPVTNGNIEIHQAS